jgi:hypothetical protein
MPAISMYRASVPVFTRVLKNMDAILDKAAAYAADKKIDPSVLLNARLAPNMFALTRQVQIVTDQIKGCVSRLAGVDIPRYEDNETTFAELKARLKKTLDYISNFKPEQIDGTEDKHIALKLGNSQYEFNGLDYLLNAATMHVYFHYTTTYAILRHNGLEIGKGDFIGNG